MSHLEPLDIDFDRSLEAQPLSFSAASMMVLWGLLSVGVVTFCIGIFVLEPARFWAAYYVNVLFWMGLAVGSVMIAVITQIVGAEWVVPVRRVAEAAIWFLPYGLILLLLSWFGKDHIFPWGAHDMPGREWWMQPGFVYTRYAIGLGVLFFLLARYVHMSLRRDVGLLREREKTDYWKARKYDGLCSDWKGEAHDLPKLEQRLGINAPILVILYVFIYSLFSFDMLMSMDTIWFSNLFGAFNFVGNIYIAWAGLSLMVLYLRRDNPDYRRAAAGQQFHDLGKLTLGFGIIWAYFFFSQFLPQWYGNMPEETQWLILRTREEPWKTLSWVTFGMAWVTPFILLLSKDLKKTPPAYACACVIALLGVWLERYVVVMPQVSPNAIPLGFFELGLFLGFAAAYVLSVKLFLTKYPLIPVAHPALYSPCGARS